MNNVAENQGDPTVAPEATAATPAAHEYTLHPRAVDLWRWQAILWSFVFSVAGVVGSAIAGKWKLALVVMLAAILAARLMIQYSRAYAARFRCRLLSDGLWIDRGVFWRSQTFVPRARVQHTDVNQGPIARHFGISALKVFTAGSHAAEIEIDGLAAADALILRDQLLGRSGHDGV